MNISNCATSRFLRVVRHSVFVFALAFIGLDVDAQSTVRGMVHDGETNHPIPLANVSVVGSTMGTATDAHGEFRFELPDGKYTLAISALGYEKVNRDIVVSDEGERSKASVHIALYPTILLHQEVLVEGRSNKTGDLAANGSTTSTEDLMDHVPGVDFLERANFGWEPVIRGMNGGQVGLVIDGVKVIGACVDKMDPTSSYVEVENLEKLELTKGGFDLSQSSQIGGSVNLVTEKPNFNRRFQAAVESGFESAASLRRIRGVVGASHKNTSVRGSFSFKQADDFKTGEGSSVFNSGFAKNNAKLDLTRRLGLGHSVTASFLADNAWDIGYPVLLMDATLAQARIYSLTHNWTGNRGILGSVETKIYANTVDHWMDDYKRDVDQRLVMRSMNMPMYGSTRTSGGISTIEAKSGRHGFSLTLDAYRTKSFGEMYMFSTIDRIPDMYLLNLGDVVVNNGAVAGEYRIQIAARVKAQFSARLDVSTRDVENEQAQAILGGRWSLESLGRSYAIPGLSGTAEYELSTGSFLRISVADVGRLPTHVENYG
ncbi:MAG: TonB-dependent receptor plug domain-containing protein, partial [Rhodothermales bacterium]|nr:TonB-dependent receptor plug domain-containing protein [Rhodothermales bacterium]